MPDKTLATPARGVDAARPGIELHDCWNRIGVAGDGSCGELQKFVHCRNCPVYWQAGVQLLNRALPEEYRREWTLHYSQEKKSAPVARTSIVMFRIGAEWLALPTTAFQEVAERRAIHSLPHRRHGVVLGLVNVRGELLICVSVGRLLGLETGAARQEKTRSTYDRMLVSNWDGKRLVFPVDEIHGIHRYHTSEVQEAPATISHAAVSYTHGILSWRGRTVGLLDADVLFSTLNRSLT
jgi:chemotaxis-related protein WspD